MELQLTGGAIEAIIQGSTFERPILQVISSKKISAQGSSADRYRLLLSDGELSYSHAMLATQLNGIMESGELDNLAVVQVEKYLCNTIQGDRRVMILLDLNVLQKGEDVGQRIGNPQQYKATEGSSHAQNAAPPPQIKQEESSQNFGGTVSDKKPMPPRPGPPAPSPYNKGPSTSTPYSIKGGAAPSPTASRVHTIASLTPYQNRWRIRGRVSQKSSIRTWSNSRGEGKLFSFNLLDDSGEIRCTTFNDGVDRFFDMIEVNKVFYVSKGNLKTANKQYSSVQNDYEMTLNPDAIIELCEDEVDLPMMTFDFVKINELENKQPNSMIDIVGIVKVANELSTVIGKQSQKEVTKRDLSLVDQSGMVVNVTLWGTDAESFNGSESPVIAVKGARLSDFGGRSISVLASSQLIINPDVREAHFLRGWYDREGQNMDFGSFRNEGMGGGGGATNWKTFAEVKSDNIGGGEKPDYFTSKGTLIFLRKENCMYKACPGDNCNKKVIDQGNGLYRCEKCSKEVPNFKWRMILSANLADFSDNQWVTCFQESAELLLGRSADELGDLRETNEPAFDQIFQEAMFKSYIFKLRAKMESYNDEKRLKTICVTANGVDWCEHGRRLVEEIEKLSGV